MSYFFQSILSIYIFITNGELMSGSEHIEVEGIVVELLSNSMFRIKLDNGHILLAHLGGKMKKNNIRLVLGDKVQVSISPYDLNRGIVTFRSK